jgi:putative guanylate kinase
MGWVPMGTETRARVLLFSFSVTASPYFRERIMTNKIYALVGPHASGKTVLLGKLMQLGIHYIPLYTTRTPGKIDSDAKFYRFVSKAEFFKQDFVVHVTYKGDYYGILKKDILSALQEHKISLVMLEANGVKQLARLLKENFETIFLMVDYVTLVERMIRLGHKNNEIKYHLEYAENNSEFDNWKDAAHVVKLKSAADPGTAFDQILAIMGLMQLLPPEKLKECVQ